MNNKLKEILIGIRSLPLNNGMAKLSLSDVAREINVSKEVILQYVKDERELVEKVLGYERLCFKNIFDENDFNGINAIDILLTVSKEVSNRFASVSPSVTFDLKHHYPEIYQEHFEKRQEFIFEKIKVNIEKGIQQGMYRQDLSVELLARLYISRLIDLHNQDMFPAEEFSFNRVFEVMFDNFIRGIATEKGIAYYEKQMATFSL